MDERRVTCLECGDQFSYVIARGNDRKYCGERCASLACQRRYKARLASAPGCEVDGCADRVRSPGVTLCEKHYMRQRRRGTTKKAVEANPPKAEIYHSNGYVKEYMPDHPLWGEVRGRLYQHRRVFFDHNGKGPFRCHWCDKHVSWDCMHVDHVNAIRDDNAIGNLVASCPRCNQNRGLGKAKRTKRKRSVTRIEWNGESLCLSEWAERVGITPTALKWRVAQGWPVQRIVTEGRGVFGPKVTRQGRD